jgi:hypothetical protein
MITPCGNTLSPTIERRRKEMAGQEKKTYNCEKCGCEADMILEEA